MTNCPWNGRGHVSWSNLSLYFNAPIHISGITEARIIKFLIQVGYIQCYQKDDISPPKWAWLWSSVWPFFNFAVCRDTSRRTGTLVPFYGRRPTCDRQRDRLTATAYTALAWRRMVKMASVSLYSNVAASKQQTPNFNLEIQRIDDIFYQSACHKRICWYNFDICYFKEKRSRFYNVCGLCGTSCHSRVFVCLFVCHNSVFYWNA